MRKHHWVIGLFVHIIFFSSMSTAHAKSSLVWEDHFNQKKINQQIWQVLEEKPYKNNELQIYRKSNVFLQKGVLKIRSERVKGKYYSGALQVNKAYAMKYGRIDIRAVLPNGKGFFPAFWMLPVANQALPEIDIMEMVGHKPNEIWQVYHYKDGKRTQQKSFGKSTGSNFTTHYHTYSLIWKPHQLTWLLDGSVIHQTNMSPDIPMRLIINTAIGGNWPGRPDNSTTFPQYMVVDWIKVYNER